MAVTAHTTAAVAAAVVLLTGQPARAQQRDFATCPAQLSDCAADSGGCCARPFGVGAIVIPMDGCHQRLGPAAADERAPAWCVDPGARSDDGVFHAYGLVYRLLQHGIPVYWIVNPTEAADGGGDAAAVDAWVLSAAVDAPPADDEPLARCGGRCAAPVARLDPRDLRAASRYAARQFPLRGGAFAIAAEDRARFAELWQARGDFSALADDERYDFAAVDLYQLEPGARIVYRDRATGAVVDAAPVAMRLDGAPPRVAGLGAAEAPAWLARAKLDDPADYPACLTGRFSPPTAVYCPVEETDVQAGYLVQGEFAIAWIDDRSDATACADAGDRALRDRIVELMTAVPGVRAGGHAIFLGGAADVVEACGGRLLSNGARPARASALAQTGDRPAAGGAAAADADAVLARYAGDPANGIVLRLPAAGGSGSPARTRVLLDALLALPRATVPQRATDNVVEVARSAPIVARVAGLRELLHLQGTYEVLDPPPPAMVFEGVASSSTFTFPHTTGHLRAYGATAIGGADTAFDDVGRVLFDAADGIPAPDPNGCAEPFTADCRTVFTHGGGPAPERILLDTGAARALRPLLGAELSVREAALLIERVLAGHQRDGVWVPRLGGVDRSTLTLVQPSRLVRNGRPTMIYVGALDGMIHAVCAEPRGGCERAGQELWAFLPRSQLPLLRANRQRVDGSGAVADVFGDFDGDGASEWRTVLVFQVGGRTPGVYALDITDPFDPRLLWEVDDLGVGLGVAMGPVKQAGGRRHLTFALTNAAGGADEAGFALAAIDTVTGEVAWRVDRAYPPPRDAGHAPVPATGIPGGVSAVDLEQTGVITHVLAPTLYGDVWLFDARTGADRYGEDVPLFRFGTDFHPIGAPVTLYRTRAGRRLHAVFGSGGYAGPTDTAWAPGDVAQYLVSIALPAPADEVPLNVSAAAFAMGLDAGTRVFAQPTVAGNELFAVVDSADVNLAGYGLAGATGALHRYSLTDMRPVGATAALPGGASSVDATLSGVVHAGAGAGVRRLDFGADFDAAGITTELTFTPSTGRQVWLRLQ